MATRGAPERFELPAAPRGQAPAPSARAPRSTRGAELSLLMRKQTRLWLVFSTASQRHGSALFPRPTRGARWRFAVGKPKGILNRKRFLRAVPCRLYPAHGAASAGGSVQAGSPAEGRSSSSRAGFQHSHEFQPQPRPPHHPSFETAGGGSQVTHKPCQGGLVLAAQHCSQLRAEEETREPSAGGEGITPTPTGTANKYIYQFRKAQ